jgi:hypothetical protein
MIGLKSRAEEIPKEILILLTDTISPKIAYKINKTIKT